MAVRPPRYAVEFHRSRSSGPVDREEQEVASMIRELSGWIHPRIEASI